MINNIGILGTGTMGKTLTLICLKSGFKVTTYARSSESASKALDFLTLELAEEKELLNNLTFVNTFEDLKNTNFIIEALAEDLEFKQNLFKDLDSILPKDIILTSTTSSLMPSYIINKMVNKERFLVAHFWNPAHLIPLVEIVPSDFTSPSAISTTTEIMKRLGKEPVSMLKEAPGFIGNRLQMALLREALYIVEQGYATVADVDKAVTHSFGRRLPVTGPLMTSDLGGAHIFNSVSKYVFKDLCNYTEGSPLLENLVNENKLGVSTDEGFYKWNEVSKEEISKKRETVLNYFKNI